MDLINRERDAIGAGDFTTNVKANIPADLAGEFADALGPEAKQA